MKLSINQKKLVSLLTHCELIIDRKSTVSALSHIFFTAKDKSLSIEATDLDIMLQETSDADVETEGVAVVPAGPIIDIVKKLPDEIIYLEKNQHTLIIKTNAIQFDLQLLEDEEFPTGTETTYPYTLEMDGKRLKQGLEKTHKYMSSDSSRYTLYGVYVHPVEGGYLRFVATDGHRLAYSEVSTVYPDSFKEGIILPKKIIDELLRVINDDMVTIKVSERNIDFSFGNVHLTSKLVAGDFVDYEQIIPKDNPFVIHVEADQLAKASDRVTTIVTDRVRGVICEFQKQKIHLSTSSEIYGKGKEQISCDYDGEDSLRLGFNAQYISDLCSQIGQGSLEFMIKDSLSSVMVKDTGDEHTMFIIMPMRI